MLLPQNLRNMVEALKEQPVLKQDNDIQLLAELASVVRIKSHRSLEYLYREIEEVQIND